MPKRWFPGGPLRQPRGCIRRQNIGIQARVGVGKYKGSLSKVHPQPVLSRLRLLVVNVGAICPRYERGLTYVLRIHFWRTSIGVISYPNCSRYRPTRIRGFRICGHKRIHFYMRSIETNLMSFFTLLFLAISFLLLLFLLINQKSDIIVRSSCDTILYIYIFVI